MKFLTQDALLVCDHRTGVVHTRPDQHFVTINRRLILVVHYPDLPNRLPAARPTLLSRVRRRWLSLRAIPASSASMDVPSSGDYHGLTHGTPPVAVKYLVVDPGQRLVEEG